MTPKASKHGRATGKSFKGVFQYLQHDKRLEGEAVRTTSERVEWMTFNNLVTDDPNLAWRIMAATAAQQDDIKRRAGQSVAGNKSDQVVFHYSLAWHPEEKDGLTHSEMIRAANESLRALGASDHQAVIIAHNDTKHPHVHVVVNRVNPEHGKMLNLWNYKKNLSRWAMAYEQERGTIYCQQRVENWNRRSRGLQVNANKDQPWFQHDQAQALGHDNDNGTPDMKAEQKAKDARLAEFGAKMHARHKAEWQAYSRDYKDGKEAIFDKRKGRTAFQRAGADVKDQFRPLWSELGKSQWRELKEFEKKEKRIAGKLENALAAISHAKELGRDSSHGFVGRAFNFLTSQKARADALDKLHRAQKRNLSAAQNAQIDVAIAKIKKDRGAALSAFRKNMDNRRNLLKDTQAADRQNLQRKWADRKLERRRAFEFTKQKEHIKKEAKAAPEASRGEQRAEFTRAVRAKRKRKGRTRKRDPE